MVISYSLFFFLSGSRTNGHQVRIRMSCWLYSLGRGWNFFWLGFRFTSEVLLMMTHTAPVARIQAGRTLFHFHFFRIENKKMPAGGRDRDESKAIYQMKSLPFVRSFSIRLLEVNPQGPRLESRWSHYQEQSWSDFPRRLTWEILYNIWFLWAHLICNPLFQ